MSASLPAWRLEPRPGGVLHVRLPAVSYTGWEQYFLLRSDVHADSARSITKMEERHLDEALERQAGIFDFGDLFDVMQLPHDKRQSKSDLREEHKRTDYFNAVIESMLSRYERYAHLFLMFARGNHETKVCKTAGVDLTAWLADSMRQRYGSPVQAGGYTGWVCITVEYSTERHLRKIWYTHGYGGGGEITKNTIQLAGRTPLYVEGADVHLCGHTHNQWWMIYPRIRLNNRLQVERRDVHFLQLPTYKDDYGDGAGGFAVERGLSPRPLGAWWMIIRSRHGRVEMDFQRAV